MENSYKTIKKRESDEYIIKKSQFIVNACPVETAEEAQAFISEISKKYWDATHNVYAYIIRNEGVKRFSDDGEPQGTAGIPVLDVLEKSNVTDCVVVVTRYFGGIMLGAGGLVRAYSHSAAIGLEKAGIITMGLCDRLKISCDYSFYGKLSSLIPDYGGTVENSDFSDEITMVFHLPETNTNPFNSALTDSSCGKYSAENIGSGYYEISQQGTLQ